MRLEATQTQTGGSQQEATSPAELRKYRLRWWTLAVESVMFRKLRNRARQAVKGRIEINLDGLELGLTPEEVIADLDFGVGPIAETARLVQERRPEVGRVA